eukprot:gene14502-17116_t
MIVLGNTGDISDALHIDIVSTYISILANKSSLEMCSCNDTLDFVDLETSFQPLGTETSSTSQVLAVAIARYQKLFFTFGVGAKTTKPASTLNLVIASSSEDLQMGVDESYTLAVSATGSLTITSNTIYGAMRGLETFSQLISYNPTAFHSLQFKSLISHVSSGV